MEVKRIDLYEYFGLVRESGAKGYLTQYIHYQSPEHCAERIRPAMLVFPGGGYVMLSDRENECIALSYFVKGFNAFVLEYSLSPNKYPTQLIESCMAMAYIRENAEKFNIDPEHIASIGFSAGGHVCGMLAVANSRDVVKEALGAKAQLCRPNAVILSYPVITSDYPTRQQSINNVSGDDEAIAELNSVEKFVTEDTPPAFIWATANDQAVDSMNSMMIANAYLKAKVPVELHLFENGLHGLSLATEESTGRGADLYISSAVSKWVELSCTWLDNRGFKIKR